MNYGYVRVSTKDQCIDRQMAAMRSLGIEESRIYVDKKSGSDFAREEYRKLVRRLRSGDTLVLDSLDRLGRDYGEIQREWRQLTDKKGVRIVVTDMPLLAVQGGELALAERLARDILFLVCCFKAQQERTDIRRRQAEGIAAAKARGVRFGRERMPLPEGFESVKAAYLGGELSSRKAAESLGISQTTFLRRIRGGGATEI